MSFSCFCLVEISLVVWGLSFFGLANEIVKFFYIVSLGIFYLLVLPPFCAMPPKLVLNFLDL